jgi:DNA-binding MarR family transcriptional regulator
VIISEHEHHIRALISCARPKRIHSFPSRARASAARPDISAISCGRRALPCARASSARGLSNADLARLSLLTPQTVSVIVANLKRAKLLESRPHAVHGRIKQLALTAPAAAVLKRCKQRVAAIEADLAAGLSASEERALRRFLVRVAVEG